MTPTGIGKMARTVLGWTLQAIWIVALILPGVTTFSARRLWDLDRHYLLLGTCWIVAALRILLPGRSFFIYTLPLLFVGVVCMAADFLRDVDVLELALHWKTFSVVEVWAELRPYLSAVAIAVLACASLAVLCYRLCRPLAPTRRKVAVALVGTLLLVLTMPTAVWFRVWPMNAVLVLSSSLVGSAAVSMYLFPDSSITNPRDPAVGWGGTQVQSFSEPQTFVLVVGETVRSDYLRECGEMDRIRPLAAGALAFCDVTAGSDATHTSVPLLVSREMPGHRMRVSNDSTFLKAFEESGFETHWYGLQEQSIVWPDAQQQSYPPRDQSDLVALLPLLQRALESPAPRKVIVLHTINAHRPYCRRYDANAAPYPVSCETMTDKPTAQNIAQFRLTYANAVDASIGFLNRMIGVLDQVPGQVFLVYTADHGENFEDDSRRLYGHALRFPTRWDIQVPAVFWANEAWRQAHSRGWDFLQGQRGAALMHADLVPTLLGAAGIRYDEPRDGVVNLLDAPAPARRRVVQHSLGGTTDWDALVEQAEAAR